MLVTGGARRVGRAIALGLAAAGADVAVDHHRSPDEAEATIAEIEALGRRAMAVAADVSDPAAVDDLVTRVEDGLGGVDVLVNSASAFAPDAFPTADPAVWHRTFDVVVHGAYHCANRVAPGMLERGRGVIVNVVDLSAWQPWPGRGAHSVAKAASLAMIRQWAVELAPGVRANAVALGPTIPPEHFGPSQIERLRARTLTGRWAGGDEAARAVRYLVEADAVTGEVLTVDGGEQYGHVRQRFE